MSSLARHSLRDVEAVYGAALAALAGFFDIGICCLLIARHGWAGSLAWAVLGAVASILVYLSLRAFSKGNPGAYQRPHEPSDGLADRLESLAADIDRLPQDDPDPWPVRWFWNVIIAAGWALFSLATILFSYPRTALTVVVFAGAFRDAWWLSVVGALVTSIAVQFLIVSWCIEPRAKGLGVEL